MRLHITGMVFDGDLDVEFFRERSLALADGDSVVDSCFDPTRRVAVGAVSQDYSKNRRANCLRRSKPQRQMLFRASPLLLERGRGGTDRPRSEMDADAKVLRFGSESFQSRRFETLEGVEVGNQQ